MNPDPKPNPQTRPGIDSGRAPVASPGFLTLLWRWLPALLWAVAIYAFSAQPSPYDALPTSWPDSWYELLGSALHFMEYTVLVFLLARALVWRARPAEPALLAAILLGALYALSDEIHQVFVPGRDFQTLDLVLDWTGALFGVWLYLLSVRQKKRV